MEFGVLQAVLTPERNKWRELWQLLPAIRRDVYYLPEYLIPFEKEGRGQACCAYALDGNSVWLHPFLKCRIDSKKEFTAEGEFYDIQSAYGYGGPVVSEAGEGEVFLDEAYRQFALWARESGIIAEFVRFHPLIGNQKWATRNMAVSKNRDTVVIDLKRYPEAIWSDPYYRVHRNMVRRATREGFTFDIVSDADDLSWFVSMYSQTQDRLRAGNETRFGKLHFESLVRGLGDSAWFGTLRKAGNIIVAVLVLQSDVYAHCHLMGYKREEMTKGMTNLVYHEIALEAAKRGLCALHMGGGVSSDERDGLLLFKKSLSPELSEFYIGTLCHDQERYMQLSARWEERFGPRPSNIFLFYRSE